MTDLKHSVGSRVREIRKEKHLTQMMLAEKVGLSLNMIGSIERGEKFPSATTFEKLAEALDVLTGDFFTFPSENPIDNKERKLALKQLMDLVMDTPPEFIRSINEILMQTNKMEKQN